MSPPAKRASFVCHRIVDDADLRIDHFRNRKKSDTVVFTFTPRLEYDMDKSGFGTDFLLGQGMDVIAVKANAGLWYQNLRTDHLMEIVRWLSWTSRPYERRLGYGSSMGAYAAIRFSGALRLDRVLCFSPVASIIEAWDRRWTEDHVAIRAYRHARNIASAPMMDRRFLAPGCDYILVYDPFDSDREHVERLEKYIDPQHFLPVKTPFTGHPAITFFHQTGLLGPFVRATLKDGRYPDFTRLRREKRGSSPTYLAYAAEACHRHGHLHWALSLIQRVLAIDPNNADAQLRSRELQRHFRQIDEARAAAGRTVAGDRSPAR